MDPTWHHHHHQHPYYNHPPPPLPGGAPPLQPPPPPPPPAAHVTICPVCSYHHFPFCPRPHHPQFFPRPPHHHYHHHHNPPPPPPPSCDPFVDPHRPVWSQYGIPYANNDYSSASPAKRMRLDDSSGSDDQRRLRMIRDHGGSAGDTLPHTNVYTDQMAREFKSPDDHFLKRSVPVEFSPPSLFPILPSSSAAGAALSLYPPGHLCGSGGYPPEQAPYKVHFAGNEAVSRVPLSPEKPKVIDASHIMKHPHRTTRPDHIVVILRGLPGSGKSYLAKMLRDLEVENGGDNPRIHSMDDYFMTEVEKVEETEVSKSGGTVRGKKAVTKKVMEYSYEPEMEEAYRSSMLKAFKRTLDDGVFNFIIVDDRNLRVADFAQFWATAKRAGYEVYLLEAAYKDPAGCAARNVHGFTLDDIQKMAELWEETPALYLKLDIKSLLHGDHLEDNVIQEVDMDMGDEDSVGGHNSSKESYAEKLVVSPVRDTLSDGLPNDDKWEVDIDQQHEEVKELGKSKWSNVLNEDDVHKANGNSTVTPGLLRSRNKEGKSVRWGDKAGNSGFSIVAAKSFNMASLVIGPGAGYNMKSNPLSDEEKITSPKSVSRKQNVFEERLRAERESFKVVFDKRKQRVSGFSGMMD